VKEFVYDGSMEPAEIGLRERKKLRTRSAIIDAAFALFDERGFDGTTVADIAAAADIAPRTFFGYFPSKEDVLFFDADATLESLRARLTEREPGETAIDALRAWIWSVLLQADFGDERERCRRRLIQDNEALAAYERRVRGRAEMVLGAAVAADLETDPGDVRASMIAAAAVAALGMVNEQYKYGDAAPSSPAEVGAVLDQALTFLGGGVEALRRAAD
jgi:AcrR family transcriptional regulator